MQHAPAAVAVAHAAAVVVALLLAAQPGPALAQTLPQAEIVQSPPSGLQPEPSESLADTLGAALGREGKHAAHSGEQYIEVYSRGKSRYEIADNGDILALYEGGVEFSYLGYRLSADNLRFDQATQAASISGSVRFTSDRFTLSCTAIELDGAHGRGAITGRLAGSAPGQGLSFEAGTAALSFPPGQQQPMLGQMKASLSDGVVLHSHSGLELSTERVDFDGGALSFSTPAFTLTGTLPASKKQPVEPAPTPPSPLQASGGSLSGKLTDQGQPKELDVADLRLATADARLSAASAKATPTSKAGDTWKIALAGQPLRMELLGRAAVPVRLKRRAGPPVPLTAHTILLQSLGGAVSLDRKGLSAADLSGEVLADVDGNRLSAESVSLTREGAGPSAGATRLALGLDLSRLLGVKPVDLAKLKKFKK